MFPIEKYSRDCGSNLFLKRDKFEEVSMFLEQIQSEESSDDHDDEELDDLYERLDRRL